MTKSSKLRHFLVLISEMVVLAVLGGPFFSVSAAVSTEPTGFKDVTLSVYPQYDDPLKLRYPTVLVMLEGQIVGATPPTTPRFLVPKNAAMYSAGSGPRQSYQPPGASLTRKASDLDGWDEVSYELKTNYFVVEYYAPMPTSDDKAFTASLIPLYPITNLTAIVQEPRSSVNFSVTTQSQPANQQKGVDSEGLNIHRYTYSALQSRQQIDFSISYTGSSAALSTGGAGPSNVGIVVVAVLAAVFLVGLAVYAIRRKPSAVRPSRGRNKRQAAESAPGLYCTSCGAKMDKSQRFCPKCGAKRRG